MGIYITRTKGGTRIRATGADAQALFDAFARRGVDGADVPEKSQAMPQAVAALKALATPADQLPQGST